METELSRIPVGGSARVAALHVPGGMRRRLLDLGMTPGTELTCLFAAPGGDPRAYAVFGTVVAVRNDDAARIRMRL